MTNFKLTNEIADQLDKLTHHVLINVSKKNRILSIVSSSPGEGSSTVAVSFALNLAAIYKTKTLLIDANLRKPILHRKFRVKREQGLTDLALKKIDFEIALKKTAIAKLFLITAGITITNPNQIFETLNISDLLNRQTEQFDYIILDCPAVNSYPEATIIASQSDGVILVVQAHKTPREIVISAQTKLSNAKAHILGVVFNRRKYFIPRWIYNKF